MNEKKPDLVVTGEELKISHTPGVEPEAQAVAHQYKTHVPMGAQGAGAMGGIPGVIQYDTTVGDVANAVKTSCAGCRHWDNRAWLQYLAKAEGPLSTAESRESVKAWRERIKTAGFGYVDKVGQVDVDGTLRAHGICHVLSDWVEGVLQAQDPIWWPVVPFREATCPTYVQAKQHRMEVTTPAEPFGLFKPRDLDAKNIGAGRYDRVMYDAAGKIK